MGAEYLQTQVQTGRLAKELAIKITTKQNKYYVTCLTGAESELTSTSKLRYGTLMRVDYYIYLLHMIVKMTVGVTAEFSLTYPAATQ